MLKLYDTWGKLLWQAEGLQGLVTLREVEIPSRDLRIDLLLLNARRELEPATRRLLGVAAALTQRRACVELFATAPNTQRATRAICKYLSFFERSLSTAALWIICAERTGLPIRFLRLEVLPDFPTGFYAIPGVGHQRLICVSELPTTPETLFLRLLGRGETLRGALHEVLTRDPEDPLRRFVNAALRPFRDSFTERDLLEPVDEELEMITREIVMEYMKKQDEERAEFERTTIQRVTEQVTRQVTQKVTEQITQKVTEQVTQKVTEQVTQKVTEHALEEGELLTLQRLCARRLHRELAASELEGLRRRLSTVGLDATLAAALDQPVETLALWLGEG